MEEKSRINWLKEGDNNTRFFHRSTAARHSHNLINELTNDQGESITGREAISELLLDYFKKRWLNSTTHIWDGDLSCLHSVIPASPNEEICRPVMDEEIEGVVMSLQSDKAEGHDGIPSEFYKKCWSTVKDDFVAAVRHFCNTNNLPPQWKSIFITIIPKVKGPTTAKEFRPISLCNVCYKTISKILVNRLKYVLPSIISQEQSAFVSDQVIMDNLLISQEILRSVGNKRWKQLMTIKIDMERAYDLM